MACQMTENLTIPAYKNYVAQVKAKITDPAIVLQKMKNDQIFTFEMTHAGDNYHFYRGTDYDNAQKLM